MRRSWPWAVLPLLVLLLFGVNLIFPRDLWVQDEARYGEAVREMVAGGHWFVPTLDGHFYPDKPPFYFWLIALQTRLTGMGMLSFRLVTLAQVLGFAAAFFVFARRLLGESRGLWAVIIALTSPLFLVAGNIVRMDVLLAALVVLSLHFLLRALDEDKVGLAVAGYGLAIVAAMVKGPLGYAFPVLGAVAHAWGRGRWQGLSRLRLAAGVGMPLLVGAVWMGYLYHGGETAYIHDVVFRQLWGRGVRSWSHPQPAYFYALVLLPLFMPWLPYLRRGGQQSSGPVKSVALGWFLPGFVLISAISGKLFVYLVPLFPPLALLVAAGLPPPWESAVGLPPARAAGVASGLFFAALGGALFGLVCYFPARLAPVAGLLVLLGAVVVVLALRGKTQAMLWATLAGACVVSWGVFGWGASQANAYFSAREVGRGLAQARQAGYEPAAVDVARGTISFYADAEVRNLSADEVPAALDAPGRLALVVREKRLSRIPPRVLGRLRLAARYAQLEMDGYRLYLEAEGDGAYLVMGCK
ncbi:MAG: glycosyltransferase family 39 protein [Pseudomonadota bacterium]